MRDEQQYQPHRNDSTARTEHSVLLFSCDVDVGFRMLSQFFSSSGGIYRDNIVQGASKL